MPDGTAPLGHNNPPDAFTAIETHVSDLLTEARNWCDGAKIESQDQADAVARLIEDFRKASTAADSARKEEARPYDEAKAAVQAKYAPLLAETKAQTGSIPRALAALKATLTPWLKKLEDERRAAELAAQEEAAKKAAEAAAAMREAQATDLGAREAADAAVAEAKEAQAAASAIGKQKSHAHGAGRAIGLRKVWKAVLTDNKAAVLHFMRINPAAFLDLAQRLADVEVREGKRQIPGFDVVSEDVV